MADLIDKMFKEDLTEAEENALDQEIASSPEAAQRFVELAEKAYKQFGLPEPEWKGPDLLKRLPKNSSQSWLWSLLSLVVLFGGYCWWYVRMTDQGFKTENSSEKMALTSNAMDKPQVVKETHPAKTKDQTIVVQAPPQSSKMIVSASVPPKVPAAALPKVQPKFTPVNVDQEPNRPFSSLAVQLRLTSSRSLEVRVLDSQGKELVPLFNGSLGAGNWAFEWNGFLKDETLAPPGLYKIEVRAGAWAQTKEVKIQK